ncbi:hypothetical protein CHLRE_13g568467v5 [Chlamydomonas reinhardtii]|uniref:Uncharacterized protein n=1 Tax=Chlamydomonas reinhardtii TaxID=3055 RepID=A0A2K3CZG5_CHLRE|nr:uncharacterized protein CHLRE_13g568467v5 [Chlamydomonas reinhardtii]XP_042917304.1 uncharacterized protein CHLRE_13g568467v5 [Chlamydomonas reinhardtii]PNW73684.1 hypothetical protein CHLRE_13g568467v5 [Chlamydomonas reinhardtii]PNW73685.1 hypothetical protein CHLRE_13g568467v5 [Chlamydomonas reinhardtii]
MRWHVGSTAVMLRGCRAVGGIRRDTGRHCWDMHAACGQGLGADAPSTSHADVEH